MVKAGKRGILSSPVGLLPVFPPVHLQAMAIRSLYVDYVKMFNQDNYLRVIKEFEETMECQVIQ